MLILSRINDMKKNNIIFYFISLLFCSNTVMAEDKKDSWQDNFKAEMFVDTHLAVLSEKNDNVSDAPHRAYVRRNGFALNLVGLDLAYDADLFGATLSLQMGPGRAYFLGRADGDGSSGPGAQDSSYADNVLEILNEAYISIKPCKKASFDIGQFGTIYGAEVTKSWQNPNYTRGALYYLMQPFWHTGLRATLQPTKHLGFKALIVNGVNTTFDFNKSPSLGLQSVLSFDHFELYSGWLGAVHPNNGDEKNALFDHFFDFVAISNLNNLTLIGNFDIGVNTVGTNTQYYGASGTTKYKLTDYLSIAGRLEYLKDPYGQAGLGVISGEKLITTTGTLDFTASSKFANLVIRPEFRYERYLENSGFNNRDGLLAKNWWQLVLGTVVHTN
jgi:hypothetical protein